MEKADIIKQLDGYFDILDTYYNSNGRFEVENGVGVVIISMTDECDDVRLDVNRFLDYMSDQKSLKKVDNTTVRTKHVRQTIIDTNKHGSDYIEKQLSRYIYTGQNYQARVVCQPFLVGLQNAKDLNCDDNICICPCTGYMALEIRYADDKRLGAKEEDELIRQILYDLTMKTGEAVFVSSFLDVNELADEADRDFYMSQSKLSERIIDVQTLPKSYEMMDLYRQAKEIVNPEIAFLHYYKIIEYVSPAVAKKQAFARIHEQLNLPGTVARDYQYMNTMLIIANQYNENQKDDYLMWNVIQECVDVRPWLQYLPDGLVNQIKNNLGVDDGVDLATVDITTDKERSLKKQLASVLYSTRNNIVHAKANYNPTGWECPSEGLIRLNQLMNQFALKVIEWNEGQEEYVKV